MTFFTADDKGERGEPIELPAEAYELNPARGTLTYDLNLFRNPGLCGGLDSTVPGHRRKRPDRGQAPQRAVPQGQRADRRSEGISRRQLALLCQGCRQLRKEILGVSHHAEEYGTALFDVHYFYGRPTALESYQRIT